MFQKLTDKKTSIRFFWLITSLLLAGLAGACASRQVPTDTPTPQLATRTATDSPPTATLTFTPTVTETPLPTATITPSLTATLTHTPSPSPSPTFTPVPTYVVLRGTVNVAQVMCFYGPSKAYLFKYELIGGSNLEIIGIMPDTQYIQVRAIGGTNPCWMNLEWMDVHGDIKDLQPIDSMDLHLPFSPYYGPLTWTNAVRSGDVVALNWSPMYLRPGDDSLQEPYLVETWVCQEGRIKFVPIGAYQPSTTVIDEPGCDQPSHGRVYGVEKHGYTRYLNFIWPPAE
jgi:hypothetical protein